MDPVLDTNAVRRITGASIRQINHWDAIGLVRPSARPASGSGSRRLYSVADAVLLAVARVMRQHGVALAQIRSALRDLRRALANGVDASAAVTILVTGEPGHTRFARNPMEVAALVRRCAFAMAVNVAQVIAGLPEPLPRIRPSRERRRRAKLGLPKRSPKRPPEPERLDLTMERTPEKATHAAPQTRAKASTWGEDW